MKNKNLKFSLYFFLGILTFYWVYNTFSGKESLKYINENKSLLILLFFAHIPTLFLDSLSWRILIKDNKISIWWCTIITWIAQTASKIMPTGILTGEFVRIYLGRKRKVSMAQISATVIGDLALATLSLMIMGIVSIFIFFYYKDYGNELLDFTYISIGIVSIMLGSLFFCLAIRYRVIKIFIRKFISIKKLKRFSNFSRNLLKTDYVLYNLSFEQKRIFSGLMVRLMGWLGGALEIYIFFWIIDIEISIIDVVMIETFTALVKAIIFFIPAGIGIQELSFILIGNFVGLSNPVAFSMALGRRFREIMVGIPAIIAWWMLFERKIRP